MKKWYPPLALGALLFVLCSMSIQGTLSSSNSADKLTEASSVFITTNEANSVENTTSFSMTAVDTQVIDMPLSAWEKDYIQSCDKTTLFKNRFEHLYPDVEAHRDTQTICPSDPSKLVFVTFTEFEVAPGDTLYVYDADEVMQSRRVAAFSGPGVSATGGWIRSECNPTGCLTFEFVTNGDNVKGLGWEAWVTCDSLENTNFVCPDIKSVSLDCDDPFAVIPITAPEELEICGELVDSFCLTIYAHGSPCLETCVAAEEVVTDTFGVGFYRAVWTAKNFPTHKVHKTFTVAAPTMICNDEVFIPLGSACALYISPDMLLESPCDTIHDTLYYRIEVKYGEGKEEQIVYGGGGPGIPYPTLYRDSLLKYDAATLCKGALNVKISRIYYEYMQEELSICTNGMAETSCETIVNFADQSPPFFYNYGDLDTVAACSNASFMEQLNPPEVIANCDSAEVALERVDFIDDINPCNTGRALVIWRAADFCGNIAYLSDTIYIVRPTEMYHPGRTYLNCDAGKTYHDAETPGLITGPIVNGKLIPHDTVHLSTEEYICGYILVKDDSKYPSDCGEKWVRDWKILDWCNPYGGPIKIPAQAVTITDTLPPVFVDCPDSSQVGGAKNPMIVDLGHFECEINMTPERLGVPTAIDNCDPNPTVSMFCVERWEEGAWWKIGSNLKDSGPLACDSFRIGWVADDICHEQYLQDTCYKYFVIRDVTRPTAICQDQLNFSVGSDWARIVGVDEIDGGSWDACGIKKREISFDGIHWDTMAILSCDAIHDDPKIHLRVTDKKGNFSICWTRINVKDDVYPSCGKLPAVNLWCDEFKTGDLGASTDTNENGQFDDEEYLPLEGDMLDSFNLKYGNPIDICDDNIKCHPMDIEQQYQLSEWPCGQTRIIRRYRAIDWGPNKSPWETQLIGLQYRPNWEITLPKDWQGECGEDFPEPRLDIRRGSCDQIGYETEDKIFVIEEEACYKVERTYHIINWCLYKAGDKPFPLSRYEDDHGYVGGTRKINHEQYLTNGYLTYVQVLKVHSFGGPDITINEVDTCLNGDGMAGEYPTTPDGMYDCDEMRIFSAEAATCVDFEELEWWWSIFVENEKVASGQGSKFSYPVNPGIKYWVSFSASDPCGNSATQNRKFEFTDCKRPTAYCRAGTAIEMGQEGKITIWASDVDLGSFDNCTPLNLLRRRLWHNSLPVDPPSNLAEVLALPENIDFNCDYFGSQIVRLYVIDKEGQYSFCTSVVDVQDNMRVCQPTEEEDDLNSFVTGSIRTTDDKMMTDVTVTATSSDGNSIATVTENGLFQLSLPKNNTYSLTPAYDQNPLNGVSTFDLVLISKHILGLQTFNSPYQYVAADVNQSGTISAYDMVQLRQLILNITQSFPNNTSWKFVESSYEFTSNNPAAEDFPESAQLSNMVNQMKKDFMAVKIGDVNQSASFTQSNSAGSRSYTAIQVADQLLEEGQTYTVDFVLPMSTTLEGYQFTLDFGNLELIEVVEATAKAENFGFNQTKRGLLTTSWHTSSATEKSEAMTLFSLVLKSNTTGQLSEQINITSSLTAAEAYDAAGNITSVKLDFIGEQAESMELYQNRPNPFRDNTAIGFYLTKAGKADLSILDVQGKVLKEIKGTYEKGYHEIQLNAAELSNTGVLYYHLTTDKKQVVKRMIVID